MMASELIKEGQFPAEIGMTVGEVRELCIFNRASELPVLKDGKIEGVLRLSLLKKKNMSELVDTWVETGIIHSVSAQTHEFDILKLMASQQLSSLAVIDEHGEYAGLITLSGIMEEISRRTGRMILPSETGSVLTLLMRQNDYSLSEIARIAESNSAKIIALYVGFPKEDSQDIEVNLLFDRSEIKDLLATFERYKYAVRLSSISDEDWEVLKSRYDGLMRYLNM